MLKQKIDTQEVTTRVNHQKHAIPRRKSYIQMGYDIQITMRCLKRNEYLRTLEVQSKNDSGFTRVK